MATFSTCFLGLSTLFSVNAMWGHLYRNGYYDAMIRLRDDGPFVLPGSNTPILTTYTGIGPLDKLATFSVVFFSNVTDGSAPQESLFALYFGGQLAAMLTLIMVEALRLGNRNSSFALPVMWWLAMQIMGYGCIMPVYALYHLIVSPTASSSGSELAKQTQIRDLASLKSLIPSIIIGYFIPTALITIPFSSANLHQWLCGFWQGFPIWVGLVQSLLGRMKYSRSVPKKASQPEILEQDEVTSSLDQMVILTQLYSFAFGAAALTHLVVLGTLVFRYRHPKCFSPLLQQTWTFSNVFVPPPFYSSLPVIDLAAAILNFFQYDLYGGSVGAVYWALVLYYKAGAGPTRSAQWALLAVKMLGVATLSGPSGICTWLLWKREQAAVGGKPKSA